MIYRYKTVIYWSSEDQAFIAEVPEPHGYIAHGATPADALTNAHQAISLWINTAREVGDPVSEPKDHRLMYA